MSSQKISSVEEKVGGNGGAADDLDSARAAELFAAQRDVHGDQRLDRQQANQER